MIMTFDKIIEIIIEKDIKKSLSINQHREEKIGAQLLKNYKWYIQWAKIGI